MKRLFGLLILIFLTSATAVEEWSEEEGSTPDLMRNDDSSFDDSSDDEFEDMIADYDQDDFSFLKKMFKKVKSAFKKAGKFFKKTGKFVKNRVRKTYKKVKRFFKKSVPLVKKVLGKLKSKFKLVKEAFTHHTRHRVPWVPADRCTKNCKTKTSCLQQVLLTLFYDEITTYRKKTFGRFDSIKGGKCRGYRVLRTITSPLLKKVKYYAAAGVNDAQKVVIFTFRGTEAKRPLLGLRDWVSNLGFRKMKCKITANCGKVHAGFQKLYLKKIKDSVESIIKPYLLRGYRAEIYGHSQGAALATLAALHVQTRFNLPRHRLFVHVTGSPRVGDVTFKNLFNRKVPNTFRYVMEYTAKSCFNKKKIITDVATRIPGHVFGYRHVGKYYPLKCGQCKTLCCGTSVIGLAHAVKCHSLSGYVKAFRNISYVKPGPALMRDLLKDAPRPKPKRVVRPKPKNVSKPKKVNKPKVRRTVKSKVKKMKKILSKMVYSRRFGKNAKRDKQFEKKLKNLTKNLSRGNNKPLTVHLEIHLHDKNKKDE